MTYTIASADLADSFLWKTVSRLSGWIVALIGGVALLGWFLDIPNLKSLTPAWVAMKANTALGFVLAGIALLIKSGASDGARGVPSIAAKILACLVATLGATAAFEYATGRDLGVDQWMFVEPAGAIGTLAPGRMAPASALEFMLVGIALLLNERSSRYRRLYTGIVVLMIYPALASLIGYLYQVPNLTGVGHATQMAVHTALAFLVLAFGFTCLQYDSGVISLFSRRDIGGTAARRLLPFVIVFPILLGWIKIVADRAGIFEPAFGVGLLAITYILVLTTLVSWHANHLSKTDVIRKEAEAGLRLAASVFSHADEGIMITDADGRIVDVNQVFSRITGYRRDEVVGRNPAMLQSGHHDAGFYKAMWQALLEQGHWSGEIWNRRKNGEAYPESLKLSAVRNADGKIIHFVGIFSDITELKTLVNELEHSANYDALTNLPNRFLLDDRIKQEISQADRHKRSLALAFIDLDGFKAVNDLYGHNVGDELLIALASRMRSALREIDTLARIGGDEFVALIVNMERPDAFEPVLLRLLQATSETVKVGTHVLGVTASIGVTTYPEDKVGVDMLIQHADQAMYLAKQAGKNRYRIFVVGTDGESGRTGKQ